uniref:WH2 domain-containing protein n=1 Tax=Macrostomum lignano TaxID=282301 RepID=A0A1I8FF49_9PLAT
LLGKTKTLFSKEASLNLHRLCLVAARRRLDAAGLACSSSLSPATQQASSSSSNNKKKFEQSIVYWRARRGRAPVPALRPPVLAAGPSPTPLPPVRRRPVRRLQPLPALQAGASAHYAPPADDGDSADAAAATAPGLGFIQRSGSESSLHSLLTAAVLFEFVSREALVIRVCPDCRDCLEFRRHRSARQQSTLMPASPISELYRQMRIDAVSLRIASLSAKAQTPDPDEASDSSAGLQKQLRQQQLAKEARLKRAIRAYAVAFVREGLLIVACLPTPDQLRELRAQRAEQQRREAEARARRRRRQGAAAAAAVTCRSPASAASATASAGRLRGGHGASPTSSGRRDRRGRRSGRPAARADWQPARLHRQARQAGRADEVRALEANLAELLAELHARQEAERRQANAAANKPPAPRRRRGIPSNRKFA